MPNANKPLTAFQKFKAPLRKTLLYQAVFHPIRSFECLKKTLKHAISLLGFKDAIKAFVIMSYDERFFLLRHKEIFGYKPDFKHPQTFNEKIVHRMLYDRNPIYTALADKIKARIYIAHKLQGFTQDSLTTRERERERERRALA